MHSIARYKNDAAYNSILFNISPFSVDFIKQILKIFENTQHFFYKEVKHLIRNFQRTNDFALLQ